MDSMDLSHQDINTDQHDHEHGHNFPSMDTELSTNSSRSKRKTLKGQQYNQEKLKAAFKRQVSSFKKDVLSINEILDTNEDSSILLAERSNLSIGFIALQSSFEDIDPSDSQFNDLEFVFSTIQNDFEVIMSKLNNAISNSNSVGMSSKGPAVSATLPMSVSDNRLSSDIDSASVSENFSQIETSSQVASVTKTGSVTDNYTNIVSTSVSKTFGHQNQTPCSHRSNDDDRNGNAVHDNFDYYGHDVITSRSNVSNISIKSNVSEKRVTAAAKAAALQAKLKMLHVENEARINLEKAQMQLEKSKVLSELEATKAELQVIAEFEDGIVETSPTALDTHTLGDQSTIINSNTNLKETNQNSYSNENSFRTCAHSCSCSGRNESSGFGNDNFGPLLRELVDQSRLQRFPPPEPEVFTGNTLEFTAWKRSVKTLIEGKNIPETEKIYYLSRYLGGEAKDAIKFHITMACDNAYTEAMKILNDRFGNPFIVSNSYREEIYSWPKISSNDCYGLRTFADFLQQCRVAMNTSPSLHILNDEIENQKILRKLPSWVVTKWQGEVHEYIEQKSTFPPFTRFVDFLKDQAKKACIPIFVGLKQNQKSEIPGSRSFSTGSKYSNETKSTSKCAFCDSNHHIDECLTFSALSVEEKKSFIFKQGLCFRCTEKGHIAKDKVCTRPMKCSICLKGHPGCFHGIRFTGKEGESYSTKGSLTGTSKKGLCKCSMIVPVWVSHKNNPKHEILTYAMLDTQSDTTFILEKTSKELNVCGKETALILSTMTDDKKRVKAHKFDGLCVRAYNNDIKIDLPETYSRKSIPANRDHIPTAEMANLWPHLSKLADELMPTCSADIGLLIGYNCPRALAPRDILPPIKDEPFGQKTDLGWGIVGVVHSTCTDNDEIGLSHRIQVHESSNSERSSSSQIMYQTSIKEEKDLTDIIRLLSMDFHDGINQDSCYSFQDKQFMKKMNDGIHKREDGHYEMPLPLSNPGKILPNNKSLALKRFEQLERKFSKNPAYHDDYKAFMKEIIDAGYAERVPDDEMSQNGNAWYIPHHGVYHPRKPGKIRVVFDCSSKFQGESLNSNLLQGPDLTNNLVGVLLRFRSDYIAFSCDIEKMFYQFYVNEEDRDMLRFIWRDDLDLREYRMNVHLFGASSSPACANFGLKKAAEDGEKEFGSKAANFIRSNFYVDDGLNSVETQSEAISLIKESQAICYKAGLRLHKFTSNCREVISEISPEDRAKELQNIDLLFDQLPPENVLGVRWCIESDTFKFRITLSDKPCTRRGILSTVSSIYDPLGFLAPVVLNGKRILQELCQEKLDWDTEIPIHLKSVWEKWRLELFHLDKIQIPRCYKPSNFGKLKAIEMHHFSDASTVGYGQCSYVRMIDENDKIHCSLLIGKARVTPLKPITVPRLELCAALLSVKVSSFLHDELEFENAQNVFWTDSKIVLGYLSNDVRRFHVFVANRVQQIRERSDKSQWKYVPTKENPADLASRGLSVHELASESEWFNGPQFLWKQRIESNSDKTEEFSLPQNDPEVKEAHVYAVSGSSVKSSSFIPFERFSNWLKLKKTIALCIKFVDKLKYLTKKSDTRSSTCFDKINVQDLANAELIILKSAQDQSFKAEIESLKGKNGKVLPRSSSIYSLDPFLDTNGILRVGGRLRNADFGDSLKHPVIISKSHKVSDIIIRYIHSMEQHQGRGITANAVRSNGYWVLGLNSKVSSLIYKCVTCRKLRSRAQSQKMADLPKERTNPSPPFTYCGVDYFGPFVIKEGRKSIKRWGVVFTCLASRAVHFEVASDLTSDAFINVLRRFLSIRGPIRQLITDSGTNFIGANNEFSFLKDKTVDNYLLSQSCDCISFTRNSPGASHCGGVWERQIRSARNVLRNMLSNHGDQLSDDSLRTLMYEVMSIINNRPLSCDNITDPLFQEPLTPNHLLTMKSKVLLPPPGEFVRNDIYLKKRWKRVQFLVNEFWLRWRKEYLNNLQSRQLWQKKSRNIEIGDIVLIKDVDTARNKWPLGIVKDVHTSDDGLVRRVSVKTSSGSCLDRPIQKLVLILENENRGKE